VPSLAEGIAALTAHVTSSEVDAAKQYVVFPNFFFPMTADSVASDGRPAAFDFIHRVNMIPDEPPTFAMTASFVWNVYENVLDNRVLPSSPDAQQGYARRFAAAKATMGDGILTPQEHRYFETSVLPGDLSTASWTSTELGPDKIKTLAALLSPVLQQWLQRFNLLPELGDRFLESVHFERLTLVVLRPWFDPQVFAWRFWNMPGEPVSDGGDPPKGRLPGVIGKLVLVRNLKMKLAAAPLSAVNVVFRRVTPTAGEQPQRPQEPVEHLATLAGAGLRGAMPLMLRSPLLPSGHDLKFQIDKQKTALATEISAVAGSQMFHVPFSYDTEGPRALVNASLQTANAAVAANRRELAAAHQRYEAYKAAYNRGRVVDHRKNAKKVDPKKPPRPPFDEAPWRATFARLESRIAQAQGEVTRWTKQSGELDKLQAIQADPTNYVLALVCDRLLKSPDPDPALFPTS